MLTEKFPSLGDVQSNVGFFALPVGHEDFEKSINLEAANIQSGALSSMYLGSLAFAKSKKAGRVSSLYKEVRASSSNCVCKASMPIDITAAANPPKAE